MLVTTGWNDGEVQAKTEVLDLSLAGNYVCQDWHDYPFPVAGATIGLLGTKIVVCGGNDGASKIDDCYSMNSKETKFLTKMSHNMWVTKRDVNPISPGIF